MISIRLSRSVRIDVAWNKVFMEDLKHRKYCIIVIEAIALSKSRYGPGEYSKIHQCLRKLEIELWNGRKRVFEFVPCVRRNSKSLQIQSKRSKKCEILNPCALNPKRAKNVKNCALNPKRAKNVKLYILANSIQKEQKMWNSKSLRTQSKKSKKMWKIAYTIQRDRKIGNSNTCAPNPKRAKNVKL